MSEFDVIKHHIEQAYRSSGTLMDMDAYVELTNACVDLEDRLRRLEEAIKTQGDA